MQDHYRAYRGRKLESRASLAAFCIWLAIGAVGPASADPTLTVLHNFKGDTKDGRQPAARLFADSAGTLFGTTIFGGGSGCPLGCGTIFKLASDGTEYDALYSFTGGGDGYYPSGDVIADTKGNLYGAASGGGTYGRGVVFKLSRDGTFAVLHSFAGGGDGWGPSGGLVDDGAGNLYGTTYLGGGAGCGNNGCGTIFKLALDRTGYQVLHSFSSSDGQGPHDLAIDGAGTLYGTALDGGDMSKCVGFGCGGTVFKLAPDGKVTVLHTFVGGRESVVRDGGVPSGRLITDRAGNLYGTTEDGGVSSQCGSGCGTVYKIAPDGIYTVLHSFKIATDGLLPRGGLIADAEGNLYGTTVSDGVGCYPNGCGTVFKLASDGTGYKVLYYFKGGTSDGANPYAGLIADSAGNLYGTTYNGGSGPCSAFTPAGNAVVGCGTVFKLSGTGFVTEKPKLKVTPASGIVAAAARGGTIFSASSFPYELAATSGSLKVEVSGLPSWLSPSFTSANVTASSPLTETFSLANLATLARGTYNVTISFTNTTNDEGNTSRFATLRIYDKDDCKNGGWESFTSPPGPFKNQGQCVSLFARLVAAH